MKTEIEKGASNYTHCCTELRDEYLQPELDKYKNIKTNTNYKKNKEEE